MDTENKFEITEEQHEETKEWLNNIKDRRKTTKAILVSTSKRSRKIKKSYKCENCEYLLENNWLYCPICGRKIDWESNE